MIYLHTLFSLITAESAPNASSAETFCKVGTPPIPAYSWFISFVLSTA